jgi:hypothetical protein
VAAHPAIAPPDNQRQRSFVWRAGVPEAAEARNRIDRRQHACAQFRRR